MVGVVSLNEALDAAEEAGLDLVEISPEANPVVCKVLDYGKFVYEQKKKAKENAKKTRESRVELKELWLRPVTDQHDIQVKVKRALGFISDGNKVKFTVKFRGRELSRTDQGKIILTSIIDMLGEEIVVEQEMKQTGRNMTMIVAPNGK